MSEKSKFIAQNSAERIDKFLTQILKEEFDFSRSMIQKLIQHQAIKINGEIVISQKQNVNIGDEIEILIPEVQKSDLISENIEFDIIYQDSDILIVDKPNNLIVHPGAGNSQGTLANGLLAKIPDLSSIGGVERPGIVHRLDRQTTGLLIVAKNDSSHKKMTEMLMNHDVYKEYLTLVWGVIDENKGIIDAPIGRHENNRKKMNVTNKNSKHARTNFEVIKRFKNATLIRVSIETGRTHQIRVHFNFIKHPVLNDPLYGRISEKQDSFGQYLHASKLIFNHPTTGERLEFNSPLPKEFNDKIKELEEEK